MVKVKITQEREKCIGCGTCVAVCPIGNWEMQGDKSKPKNTSECDYNLACQENCPVQCIHVKKL